MELFAGVLVVPPAVLIGSPKRFERSCAAKAMAEGFTVKANGETIKRKTGIRNVVQVIAQSSILITALTEALEFDELRQDNLPPPALRIELTDREMVRELIEELRRLNQNLVALHKHPSNVPSVTATKKSAAASKTRVSQFLDTFVPSMGKTVGIGSGMLVVGAGATLLYYLGMPETVFDMVLRKSR